MDLRVECCKNERAREMEKGKLNGAILLHLGLTFSYFRLTIQSTFPLYLKQEFCECFEKKEKCAATPAVMF